MSERAKLWVMLVLIVVGMTVSFNVRATDGASPQMVAAGAVTNTSFFAKVARVVSGAFDYVVSLVSSTPVRDTHVVATPVSPSSAMIIPAVVAPIQLPVVMPPAITLQDTVSMMTLPATTEAPIVTASAPVIAAPIQSPFPSIVTPTALPLPAQSQPSPVAPPKVITITSAQVPRMPTVAPAVATKPDISLDTLKSGLHASTPSLAVTPPQAPSPTTAPVASRNVDLYKSFEVPSSDTTPSRGSSLNLPSIASVTSSGSSSSAPASSPVAVAPASTPTPAPAPVASSTAATAPARSSVAVTPVQSTPTAVPTAAPAPFMPSFQPTLPTPPSVAVAARPSPVPVAADVPVRQIQIVAAPAVRPTVIVDSAPPVPIATRPTTIETRPTALPATMPVATPSDTTVAVTRLLECSDPVRAHAVTLDSGHLFVDPTVFVKEGRNCPVSTTLASSNPEVFMLPTARDQRVTSATISPDNRIIAVVEDLAEPHTLRALLVVDVGSSLATTAVVSKPFPEFLQIAQVVRGVMVTKDASTGIYTIDIVIISAAGTSTNAHCDLARDDTLTCTDLPAATPPR